MGDTEELEINFRIHRIETLQFAILQEVLNEEKLSIGVSFGFGIDVNVKTVRSIFKYEFLNEEKTAVVIEAAVDFEIEPIAFDEKISKDNLYILPKSLAEHITTITVGTTRGILHEKTKGTSLNIYPMPTINVRASISEDVVFEIDK